MEKELLKLLIETKSQDLVDIANMYITYKYIFLATQVVLISALIVGVGYFFYKFYKAEFK